MARARKRKKFFDISIPIINTETQLLAYGIEELKGRTIKYDLTKILRGKSILLNLKVEVENEKATAHPIGTRIMPYYLRRMVRKGTDYVEDSFSAKCKNARLIVKPFLIARRKVSRKVKKALREKARQELKDYFKEKNTEQIFDDLIKNQIQKPLSLTLKKIYPLSLCEIRILKVDKFFDEEKSKKGKTDKEKKK